MNLGNWLMVLLTVLFVGLKLTGYIAWSWFWVLSPLWIGAIIAFIALLIFFVGCVRVFKKGRR